MGASGTKWKSSSQGLVDRFGKALPDDARAERRKMFGYQACFVNGNYFVGLHEERIVARLPDGLNGKFPPMAKAEVFDPMKTGKGMKGWFVVPTKVANDARALEMLIAAMFPEVLKLPPKVHQARAARGTGSRVTRRR